MPGTSGTLTPYNAMENLYFDNTDEPDTLKFDFLQRLNEIVKDENISCIKVEFSEPEDFYRSIDTMRKFLDDNVSIKSTSRFNHYDIIFEEDEDLEENKK